MTEVGASGRLDHPCQTGQHSDAEHGLDILGTAPPGQLDLFNPPSPLLGLRVVRSDPCPKCRSCTAAIGTGKPPHVASLICAVCHRFVAWLPKGEHDFINSVVTEFGRPTEPVVLRSRSTPTESA